MENVIVPKGKIKDRGVVVGVMVALSAASETIAYFVKRLPDPGEALTALVVPLFSAGLGLAIAMKGIADRKKEKITGHNVLPVWKAKVALGITAVLIALHSMWAGFIQKPMVKIRQEAQQPIQASVERKLDVPTQKNVESAPISTAGRDMKHFDIFGTARRNPKLGHPVAAANVRPERRLPLARGNL